MQNHSTPVEVAEDGDFNLIEVWLRFDLPRLIAGFLAGLFAGIVMMVVAGIFATLGNHEFLYPVKLASTPFLGNEGTTLGMNVGAILLGFVILEIICGVLGAVYAHFTKSNKLLPLLGAGFMWGTFSWVFINNLFSHSFQDILTADLPAGPAFFVCLAFGFALVSVRFFDAMVCGKNR